MLDEAKFNEGMAILCEMFGREANKFLLKGYFMVLKDLSNEQFEHAITHVMGSHKFSKMPLPAEIKEQVLGKSEDMALLALDKLQKAMSKKGKYASVCFDDPLIHACVSSLGGWIKLCSMELEEWKWVKKDFERLYKAFASNPEAKIQIPDHLPGIIETQNSANGYQVDKLRIEYVGEKAMPLLSAS